MSTLAAFGALVGIAVALALVMLALERIRPGKRDRGGPGWESGGPTFGDGGGGGGGAGG